MEVSGFVLICFLFRQQNFKIKKEFFFSVFVGPIKLFEHLTIWNYFLHFVIVQFVCPKNSPFLKWFRFLSFLRCCSILQVLTNNVLMNQILPNVIWLIGQISKEIVSHLKNLALSKVISINKRIFKQIF